MSVRLLNRPAKREREAESTTAPGAYVTDGTRLFRCLETHEGGVVLLEDCASLECIHLYFEEMASGMRLVKPAAECGAFQRVGGTGLEPVTPSL